MVPHGDGQCGPALPLASACSSSHDSDSRRRHFSKEQAAAHAFVSDCRKGAARDRELQGGKWKREPPSTVRARVRGFDSGSRMRMRFHAMNHAGGCAGCVLVLNGCQRPQKRKGRASFQKSGQKYPRGPPSHRSRAMIGRSEPGWPAGALESAAPADRWSAAAGAGSRRLNRARFMPPARTLGSVRLPACKTLGSSPTVFTTTSSYYCITRSVAAWSCAPPPSQKYHIAHRSPLFFNLLFDTPPPTCPP